MKFNLRAVCLVAVMLFVSCYVNSNGRAISPQEMVMNRVFDPGNVYISSSRYFSVAEDKLGYANKFLSGASFYELSEEELLLLTGRANIDSGAMLDAEIEKAEKYIDYSRYMSTKFPSDKKFEAWASAHQDFRAPLKIADFLYNSPANFIAGKPPCPSLDFSISTTV